MPSPFPGMDPYLEEPSQWPGVHQRLITYMADAMQPRIRPRYHVLIGERVYIAEPPHSFSPDVTLLQYSPQRAPAESALAVVEPDTPTAVGNYLDEAQRQPFIEIVHADTGTVVTIIEVLSPSNKIGAGRQDYLRQQERMLSSGTHLVEIDLLRVGEHTVACPKEKLLCPISIWCVSTAPPRAGLSTVFRCSIACPASAFPCSSRPPTLS
jgi:uncharacterized protein DUF4058